MSIGGLICPVTFEVKCSTHRALAVNVVQGSHTTFQFTEANDTDLSTASEVTFDIWRRFRGGANLFSSSLTGGGNQKY